MERLQELFTHHMILPTYMMRIIFGVVITVLLFLELFVFHKKDEEPTIGETFRLSAFYIIIAQIFGGFIIYEHGMADGMLYYTGYLVEKSLSMDNIFVISLIFSSLNIPTKYQHRVLFWGVLGAIVMRALMIGFGAQLARLREDVSRVVVVPLHLLRAFALVEREGDVAHLVCNGAGDALRPGGGSCRAAVALYRRL